MAKEKGIDVIAKVGVDDGSGTIVQTAVAGFTSESLTIDGNQIDTSSGDEPDWETHVVDRGNWSMSHSGRLVTKSGALDATLEALLDATMNGTKLDVEMDLGKNGPTVTGTASVRPFEVNGSDGEAAEVTADFNGDGALTKA